ncbi:MAG: PASTA domain-containing protein [Actinomycetales bacterium]|nr:MAG: PASTA domain-containing protein [Actinomycetales bacterium]
MVALPADDPARPTTRPVAENTVQWSSAEWDPAGATAAATAARMTPAMSPKDYQDAKEPPSSSRRGRFLLVAAVLLALVVAGGAYYFAVARYTEAPVLVGQSEKEAKAEAVKAGFTFDVAERRFSETALLGTVMESDPDAGAKVLPGSTIEVVVSKGKERYAIPNLRGKTVEQARAALSKLNLRLGETPEKFSEKVPDGRVIQAVDVKVKQLVKRNTVIDLVISKGRQPIDVPDVKGATQAEAKTKIEGADLKVAFTSAFSDTVDKGRVISQDPGDGTLFRNDTVNVVISKGPENVPVPDVMGKERNEAVRLLRAAGFVPRVRNVIPGSDQVRFQSPSGGKAKVGSDVTIYV